MVEVTTNGGRSWLKSKPGLTAIVRLKAYGEGSVFAIGADDDCRPTYASIAGPGQEWQLDRSRVRNIWYRIPNDLNQIHAPSGRRSKPCGDDLVSLAGLGTYEAAVLCADGRIRTDMQGRSWRTVQTGSTVVSLNADDNRFVAVGTSGDCKGVVVHRFYSNADGLRTTGDCRSKITAAHNATAVSVRGQKVWLWSGAQVFSY